VYSKPEGDASTTGYGDVRVQLGWNAFDDREFRMFFAGGVILDTAAEDETGTGRDQVVAMIAGSGSIPEITSRLYETFEHFVSFAGDENRPGIALSKLDIHLMTEWANQFWTQTGGTFLVDWKGGEHTGLTFDVEIGRTISSNAALWVRPGVGVWGDDVPGVYDWNIVAGVRWLF
jgi:hypothetical protein